MSKTVISVEHLTKRYDLGVIGTGTLSRDLNRWWAQVRHQPDPYTKIGQEDKLKRRGESILALDDVSFTVQQGEALGIIGKNGAGKSTLLKILSRVTAPTSGVVKVRGRMGSLLEVGTGFHPELTGRENVFLNGAILGMRKDEVSKKFDEIVDFSGVERFIDTPVKRYSSGMYVRLAFAVAAHLDPEILVVDEVLAVGDAEFQKKCLGKMSDVASEGRTVLFVSHNMAAIQNLCQTSMLLQNGLVKNFGDSDEIITFYLSQSKRKFNRDLSDLSNSREGNGLVRFLRWTVVDPVLGEGNQIISNQTCKFNLFYKASPKALLKNVSVAICIKDQLEKIIFTGSTEFTNSDFKLTNIQGVFICEIPNLPIMPGNYKIHLWCSVDGEKSDRIEDAGELIVNVSDYFGTGRLPKKKHGYFLIEQNWRSETTVL